MEVERGRCMVGPVHDMVNVRIRGRAYGVSFLVRSSQRCMAGSLRLDCTPHIQKVNQLVNVDWCGGPDQQGAVLTLPLEDFELLEPNSPFIRQQTPEFSHRPCQPSSIEGSEESPGSRLRQVNVVSTKFFDESRCANWSGGGRQRLQSYAFDTRLINHL
jgi:hypothetical protein